MLVKQDQPHEVKPSVRVKVIARKDRILAGLSARSTTKKPGSTCIDNFMTAIMILLLHQNLACHRLVNSSRLESHQNSTGELSGGFSLAAAKQRRALDDLLAEPSNYESLASELDEARPLLDEDEEDEEDFFSQSPFDRLASASEGALTFDDDDDSEVHVKDSDFQGFDDHEALQTDKFYSQPATKNQTRVVKAPRAKSRSKRYQTSASYTSQATLPDQMVACAVNLARGGCVTYQMVNWAIRRARMELDFGQPADLNSNEPSEATINSVGELVETSTRILAARLGLTAEEAGIELSQVDVSQTSLWSSCPLIFRRPPRCPPIPGRYRRLNGQCNNPLGPHLGSSNMAFMRMLEPEYADAIGLPRRSVATGNELPPVRLVSLNLHPDVENPNDDLSMLFMSWGQLINHDLALASGAREQTGHSGACCPASAARQRAMYTDLDRAAREVCLPVEMGPDDPFYAQYNVRCHDFKRSISGLRPGCSLGVRTQVNLITSFVDASFVYGSQSSTMEALRSYQRGLLATWNYFEGRNLKVLLPPQLDEPDLECVGRREGRFCFRSGDARTNQQVPLVALHTIHTRQHNRIARALSQLNPHWSDELVYQESRHIHIAMVQHILISEYLPALLGARQCAKYNLTESSPGSYWDHYEPDINPSISQEFAAAAFRFGHSTVPSLVYRFGPAHEPRQVYQLRQLFRQPWPLFEPGAMDEFLLGLLDVSAQSNDPFISHELSGHLLETPARPYGFDLASINLQRGRDQGLAGYNAAREWCGLGKAKSFTELDLVMSKSSSLMMASLYESVDDIDLFTGGMSEFPLEGAQVGPTFACIIGRQFHALRAGDRYWFESSSGPHAFTPDQLDSIRQVSLARLVCANSDQIITIQERALHMAHPVINPRQFCHSLPDLDISLWLDLGPAQVGK